MNDLMEALYTYAQRHGIAAFLAEDEEYERCVECAQAQEGKLRAALTPGEADNLKALLNERDLEQCIQNRAAFSAGLRMALELMR